MTFLPKYVCWSHDLLPLVGMQMFFSLFPDIHPDQQGLISCLTSFDLLSAKLSIQEHCGSSTGKTLDPSVYCQFLSSFCEIFNMDVWIGGLFSGALLIPWGWQDCIPNDGITTHFIHLGFFFNLFLISRAVLDFLRFGFSQCESEGYKVVSCSFIPSKLRCCFMVFIKAPIRSCSCRNCFFFSKCKHGFISEAGSLREGP